MTNKIALVSGANRGLGLAVVRGLCRELGSESTVYLTARDREKGERAVSTLNDEGLHPRFAMLDVDDDESVRALAERIESEHRQIDIVISNAARPLVRDVPQSEQVEAFVSTNNRGTHRMLRHFGPLLADGARYLIVASGLGRLRYLSPPIRDRFAVDSMMLGDVDALMTELVHDVRAGIAEERGWGGWINVASKVGQVASMKIFARESRSEAERRDILVNAVCPGMLDTEASRPWFADMSRAQSPDAAAEDVIWLATLPPGTRAPYGELVQHRRVRSFHEIPANVTTTQLLAEAGIVAPGR